MAIINIHDAKTHFSKILIRVNRGEEVIIAKAGKPVAKIIPIKEGGSDRVPGSAKGMLTISDEFFKVLPDSVIESFEK